MSRLKVLLLSLLAVFNILFVYYLLLPSPVLPPLTDSVRSLEPGDTVQLKNVSAYYSNLTRSQVLNFYKAYYSGPLRLILNHPPETARAIIKDTIQSYYLYEFVLPFKETLFINGYEWENDVFTKPTERLKNQLIYDNKIYAAKITLKSIPTTPSSRLINFYLVETLILTIVLIYLKLYRRAR
jgi:hypothetical protein